MKNVEIISSILEKQEPSRLVLSRVLQLFVDLQIFRRPCSVPARMNHSHIDVKLAKPTTMQILFKN